MKHKVKAFCLTGSGNQTKWEMLRLVVRYWGNMEEKANGDGPFIYSVTSKGSRRLYPK